MPLKKNIISILLLILVSLALYWQTTGFELVWDDIDIHLTYNPYLLKKKFIHFWKEPYRGLYIPISYNVWGLLNIISIYFSSKVHNPFIYHLANIFLHSFNSILVFVLLRFFVKSFYPALTGALLFLAHPIQVETVAFVSELRGLLSAFFGFTSIICYIKSCDFKPKNRKKSLALYIISYLFFILGLLSKPSIAILPLFLLLIEYYYYRKVCRKLFFKLLLWFLSGVIVTALTYVSQKINIKTTYSLWTGILIFTDSIVFYFYKILFPFSLALLYGKTPYNVISKSYFYITWIIPAGIGYYIWRIKNKHRLIMLSALFFIFGLLPVSGFFQFTFQNYSTVADRYLYIPMFGAALLFAYMAALIKKKRGWVILSVIITFILLRSFFVQIPVWTNNIILFTNSIKIQPFAPEAYSHRGKAYYNNGQYNKALSDFSRSISINPKYPKFNFIKCAQAYNGRGNVYFALNKYDTAMKDYNAAIDIEPENSGYHFNKGSVYIHLGQYDEAILCYDKAIIIKPDFAEAYNYRGISYSLKKQYYKAILDYNKAISIEKSAIYYYNRGKTYYEIKKYKKAIDDYTKAIQINPYYAEFYNYRGIVYYTIKEYDKAKSDYNRAISIKPQYEEAYYNLRTLNNIE